MKQLFFPILLALVCFANNAKGQPSCWLLNNTGCDLTIIKHCYDYSCSSILWSSPQISLAPNNCFQYNDPTCEGEIVYEIWWSDPNCMAPHAFVSEPPAGGCFPVPQPLNGAPFPCNCGPAMLMDDGAGNILIQ